MAFRKARVERPLGAACHKASFAQDRFATLLNGARLERNLARCTTLGAYGVVHLAGSGCALVLAGCAAILAALWSAQVLAGIKFLFTVGERELLTAIAACKLLISHKIKKKESK